MNKIKKLANEIGFDSLEYIGEWNQFKVYIPYSKDDKEPPIIGIPIYILEKGNTVRFSTPEESFPILNTLFTDDG